MLYRTSIATAALLLLSAPAASSAPASAASPPATVPTGVWRLAEGFDGATIRFARCQGDKLCGTVDRLGAGTPADARDVRNPDRNLRTRRVAGLTVFGPLTWRGNRWTGPGYSPQDGRHFTANLVPSGNGLKMRGCVAVFCREVSFIRAS